jgi:fructoselysine-6-P-deglycase FrlB-like protein
VLGRPFDEELALLPATYSWALQADIEDLAKAVGMGSHLPQRSVGSGGSLSAATFAAELHHAFTSQLATAVTPLEIAAHSFAARASTSLFLSASGRNPDIIGAFRSVVERGAPWISVICMQQESPLARVAAAFPQVGLFEFDSPAGGDGFLATNSLLGLCLLLTRSYQRFLGIDLELPQSLEELLGTCSMWKVIQDEEEDAYSPLWTRATTIVLHGSSSRSSAVDLESKLTEAALAAVQVSDYRNFAHGRHHWLAKRAATSGILALVTDDDREVAERTLSLIPESVPVVRLDIRKGGPIADLTLIVLGMYVTRSAGIARAIDPGRPRVPPFGRRLYHLNAFARPGHRNAQLPQAELHAIERKSGDSIDLLARTGKLEAWRRAYSCFVRDLHATRFTALALDYDGTLCDRRERFKGIGTAVVAELERLIVDGVAVGIATGRGRSVRMDLQAKLSPGLWERVEIGYYNGAEVGQLSDDDVPSPMQDLHSALLPLAEALQQRVDLLAQSVVTCRRYQITIESSGFAPIPDLWEIVQEVVQASQVKQAAVLRSSHSVDILAPGISKLRLVQRLRDISATSGSIEPAILCIGDRGQWPGNDFALLSHPSSLSVDEVSKNPKTCWNLAPAGLQGATAAVNYLQGLDVISGGRFVARLPRSATRSSRTEESGA